MVVHRVLLKATAFLLSTEVLLSEAFSLLPLPSGRRTSTPPTQREAFTSSQLNVVRGRSDRRGGGYRDQRSSPRSKRQERVGHLVQTELSRIIHSGSVKGRDVSHLDDGIRQRIGIVSADVSPDLRQARISVSIRGSAPGRREQALPADDAVDKRRAYSWLVTNTKAIRHALAQRMSHMKACPSLTFVQVDVSAAVDVMYLIDQVSKGKYKRSEDADLLDGMEYEEDDDDNDMPSGVVGGVDFDQEIDDEDWEEEDDELFL